MQSTHRPSRESLHMKTALMWANRSLCKRLRVGAVITSGDMKRILSIGYNGPAKGLSHDSCSGIQGNCGCLHAEENAILALRSFENEMIMFTTVFPCKMCAQRIVQAGICKVIFLSEYRNGDGGDVLRNCGVETVAMRQADLA